MRRNFVLLAGLTLLLPGFARAEEEDAVRVFRQLRRSVVSLQNIEGSGTGIIVNASGLILTNAHVVASPLPFQVKVETGKDTEATYSRVQVVGYHPRLDLALVKIDPKEQPGALTPVNISRSKASPGQRIFVIGDPGAGGMILTHTITSGMVSGVDRVVEGEKYYQTDAAINPGNSGGPMCDRTGAVLGLVTFKFSDAQATGFAIPLHDVDLKGFQPIAARKVDREKSVALAKLAEAYSVAADRVGRAKGMDCDERKMLNAYAAMCYRLALLHDPGNPAIYYNVGTCLQRIGENEVAAGYLARALAMEPWDKSNGDPYRELGLSLMGQKRDADAMTVWKEGLAKSPYAAKIWEDLAVTYLNQQRYPQAALAAATALLIHAPDARVAVLKKIQQEATQNLSGSVAKSIEEQTSPQAIIAALDKLLGDSNAARKEKRLWVTPAFAQWMKSSGVEPVPGVENTISPEPIARRALGVPAVTEVARPAPPTTRPAAAGGAANGPAATQPAAVSLITSARWGGGKNWADVTARLNERLAAGKRTWANTKDLGADPTPGWRKKLQISYTKDGKNKTMWVDEDKEIKTAELLQGAEVGK